MATRVIDDSKLQDIAVAIQGKDGGGTMTVDEMPGRIALLPAAPVENPALILWDWEGTKLAEYDETAALALTALPAPGSFPYYAYADHDLLLFQEWNWSIANIKTWIQNNEGECLDVGAIYTTTDGQDHNYWGNPRLDTTTTITVQKRGTVSIGDSAFRDCYTLTQINIPNNMTIIRAHAFRGCLSLTQINISDSVTIIGAYAFSACRSLTRINISDSVRIMEEYAFKDCNSLTHINMPDSIRSIEIGAFDGCVSLTRINIPKGMTSIETSVFQNCYSLTQINIPDGVTSIGDSAFYNCATLCDILLESKPTLANTNTFSSLPTNYKIYVSRADLSWFETATNWSTIYTQGHIVAIEDNIEYLESLGFDVDKYKEATV